MIQNHRFRIVCFEHPYDGEISFMVCYLKIVIIINYRPKIVADTPACSGKDKRSSPS